MKAIYTILIIFFLVPVLTNCKKEKPNKFDVRNYKTELKLTQKQLTQLDSLYISLHEKAILISNTIDPEAKKEQTLTIQKEMIQEVGKILTPDQKKKLRKILDVKTIKKDK